MDEEQEVPEWQLWDHSIYGWADDRYHEYDRYTNEALIPLYLKISTRTTGGDGQGVYTLGIAQTQEHDQEWLAYDQTECDSLDEAKMCIAQMCATLFSDCWSTMSDVAQYLRIKVQSPELVGVITV